MAVATGNYEYLPIRWARSDPLTCWLVKWRWPTGRGGEKVLRRYLSGNGEFYWGMSIFTDPWGCVAIRGHVGLGIGDGRRVGAGGKVFFEYLDESGGVYW